MNKVLKQFQGEVASAYRRAARQLHPDLNEGHVQDFHRLTKAYEAFKGLMEDNTPLEILPDETPFGMHWWDRYE